jgi:type I restriction enzyme S subunit
MELECPDGWELVTLRELGEVNRGRSRHRPRYSEHLYGGPYPFIQTGDVKASNGRVSSYTQTYSEAGLAQSRLWPAGTMCITIAANIAETGILTFPACFPDSVVGFIAEPKKADVHFVEYMFRFMRSRIQHQATGSVQDNINMETLERLRFPIPPLPEQRAIASVLGALDDKIELNRRMNATLEAMARALFQSWFVDFDPVRAKLDGRQPEGIDAETAELFPAEFEESTLGPIPKGWEVGTVVEGFNLTMGQSPPGDTYNEEGKGLPFYQGRTDFGFRFPTRRIYCTAPTRYAKPGDTLVSVRAPVGDINMANEECCIGRGVAAVRHKSGATSFTYHSMANLYPDFARFEAEGTVFGSINKDSFEKLRFVIPPDEIVAAYERQTGPLDEQIRTLENQSRTLATLRDTLLPKLLSGELQISASSIGSAAAKFPSTVTV